jgi:hypothetical protein
MNEPDATFTNGRYELPPHARGVLVLADPPEAGWRIHTDPAAPAARAGRGKGAPSPTAGGGAQVAPGPTRQRAVAPMRCKHTHGKARRKCKRRAKRLPL